MGVVLPFPNTTDTLGSIRASRLKAEHAERTLGDALLQAHLTGLHHALGYASFAAFVRGEAGIGRRRAARLLREAEDRRSSPAPLTATA